jgi:hypothetical protein
MEYEAEEKNKGGVAGSKGESEGGIGGEGKYNKTRCFLLQKTTNTQNGVFLGGGLECSSFVFKTWINVPPR